MSSTIEEIIAEISGKMNALDGVVSYSWDSDRISTVPAVLVGLPRRTQYRTAYSRRGKKFTISMVVLVSRANARSAHLKLVEFLENSGARSVFRTVDSEFTTYTTCDDVTVVEADEPEIWINNGVQYLGVEFTIDVTATGE